MKKIYVTGFILLLLIVGIVWKTNTSNALDEEAFLGNNIIVGKEWGVNITSIDNILTEGETILLTNPGSISTTFRFDVEFVKPNDKLSFDMTVTNNSNLPAELYEIVRIGLDKLNSEVITYTVVPIDDSNTHTDSSDGTIINKGETQVFHVEVEYKDNIANADNKNIVLNLGGNIIYKQK